MGNSHAQKVFETLDKDHRGELNIDKICNSNYCDQYFDTRACSLSTFYHFDIAKQGCLSLKEFVELEKYVLHIQKRVKKQHLQKKLLQDKRKSTMTRTHSSDTLDIFASHSQPAAGSPMKRSTSTRSLQNSLHVSENSCSTRMFTSYDAPVYDSDESSGSDSMIQHVQQAICVEMLPSLNKTLADKNGRQSFLEWLFKTSDCLKENKIYPAELKAIIRAVEQDGIEVRSLLYDLGSPSELVGKIMEEYDVEKHGYLCKAEFMQLGDLILKAYTDNYRDGLIGHRSIGEWDLTHTLGEGSYGIVKCATNQITGEKRAIKVIKRGNVSDMSRLDVEIQAMMTLRHDNVVRLYDVLEDEDHIYLIMELCGGGSLHEHLNSRPFAEDLARYYFDKLIDGLQYCHSQGICHRDLRLENLLLDNNGNLKITDFGQAGIFKKGWDLFSTQLVGSLYHLSPEQLNNKVYSGEKIDIWSAGIILYCLLTSKLPFASLDALQLFDSIKNAKYPIPEGISPEALELINRILQADPEKRPSLAEIKQSRWLQGNKQQPMLIQHQLDLEASVFQNVDIVWNCLRDFLSENEGVHIHESKFATACNIRFAKCLLPSRDLKFSVSLLAPDGQHASNIVLQFNLRAGESLQLERIYERVKKSFGKIVKKSIKNKQMKQDR